MKSLTHINLIILYLCLLFVASGTIVDDGIWTGHDIDFHDQNVKIRNGIAYKIIQDGGIHAAFMKDLEANWSS